MLDHHFEFCDQLCRHIRFDAHNQISEAIRKRGRQIHPCLENERQRGCHHVFDNGRNIPVDEIGVENRARDGMRRQQGQRFIYPCRRTSNFPFRVLDRNCDVQCDEGFVLGDKNGLVIEQGMFGARGSPLQLTINSAEGSNVPPRPTE